MKRFFVIGIPLLLGTISLSAQQQVSLFKRAFIRPPYDSSYVDSYYDHFLHITAISVSQNHYMEFANSSDNIIVRYKPNNAFTFGIGLDFRYFSLEYTKTIEAIDKPDPEKGPSENFSLRLGITGRRFLASTLIQSYKGMHISNPGEIVTDLNPFTEKYPQRPDVSNRLLLGSLNYIFRHERYSTMASLWQIDRQKKSAGSFIAGVTASASHVKGDSSLIPYAARESFRSNERILEHYSYLGGINGGYGHNFIFFKYFFVNLLAIPGIDLQFGEYTTVDRVTSKYKATIGYHADLRVIGGYNGKRYYSGVHYSNYFISNYPNPNMSVNLFNGYFRIFFGRRLDLRRHQK